MGALLLRESDSYTEVTDEQCLFGHLTDDVWIKEAAHGGQGHLAILGTGWLLSMVVIKCCQQTEITKDPRCSHARPALDCAPCSPRRLHSTGFRAQRIAWQGSSMLSTAMA